MGISMYVGKILDNGENGCWVRFCESSFGFWKSERQSFVYLIVVRKVKVIF